MNFGDAINTVLKKYACFRGRASRSEFWYFFLLKVFVYFSLIVSAIFLYFFNYSGWWSGSFSGYLVRTTLGVFENDSLLQNALVLEFWLFTLLTLLPSVGVAVRRLHDIGKSGLNLLLYLIPFVGPFILFFFFVRETDYRANEYDEDYTGEVRHSSFGLIACLIICAVSLVGAFYYVVKSDQAFAPFVLVVCLYCAGSIMIKYKIAKNTENI